MWTDWRSTENEVSWLVNAGVGRSLGLQGEQVNWSEQVFDAEDPLI